MIGRKRPAEFMGLSNPDWDVYRVYIVTLHSGGLPFLGRMPQITTGTVRLQVSGPEQPSICAPVRARATNRPHGPHGAQVRQLRRDEGRRVSVLAKSAR